MPPSFARAMTKNNLNKEKLRVLYYKKIQVLKPGEILYARKKSR